MWLRFDRIYLIRLYLWFSKLKAEARPVGGAWLRLRSEEVQHSCAFAELASPKAWNSVHVTCTSGTVHQAINWRAHDQTMNTPTQPYKQVCETVVFLSGKLRIPRLVCKAELEYSSLDHLFNEWLDTRYLASDDLSHAKNAINCNYV